MSLSLGSMSLKLKLILLIVGLAVVTAGWYLISYKPGQKEITQLNAQVATVRQQVAELEAQLKHLQELKAAEPKLRAKLARFDTALPREPRLPEFILQINDVAAKARVDFIAVAPSQPAAQVGSGGGATTNTASGLQQISVSVSTRGSYFALQNFLYRLETLNRALRVDTFSIGRAGAQTSGGSPQLQVSLSMRMFMSPASGVPATTSTSGTGA
jgi:Tfp pilus assembly protein PilO